MNTYGKPLLNDADLKDLTGLTRPGDQSRWLVKNGIAFYRNCKGRPRTTWAAVNAVLLGAPSPQPDFSKVR